MKVSVSLSQDDVSFLDKLAEEGAYPSRSAALAAGVRLLRHRDLAAQYAEAISEWEASGEAETWDAVTADDGELA